MRILGYILVVLFVTTSAFGQQINPVPDYIFRYQMSVGRNAPTDTAAYLSVGPRYGANKGLMPPMVVDTNAVTGVKRNGLLIFSVQLNNFAYWDSTTSRFRKITAEAVVDSVLFATRAWRKKGDDSLGAVISQRTDTAMLSTRAYRQKGVDSLVTLISTLGGGTVLSVSAGTGMNFTTITTSGSVNADTNVLATRANRDKLKDSLQANIAGKVNISDTSTMLSAYLRKADTTSMLSPYLRKTDTTAMLTPYVRNAGFGLTKGTQALSVDSALIATRARVQKGIDSVASLVTTTDSVLFSTRAWRQKGVDSVAALANTKATATGTTNYLSKFTGTSSLGNSIVYATTSEVGISTPSPTHPLDVNGRVRVRTIDSTATGMNMLYADVDGVIKKAAVPAGGSGSVTSVSAGTGMSFTTITTTGSVSADTVALATRAWRQKGIDSLANVRVGGSGTTNRVAKFTASGTIGDGAILDNGSQLITNTGDVRLGNAASTGDVTLDMGTGRTGNGNTYIDLIGDATYTDYGLRIIRGSGGANATSTIEHRGTGLFTFRNNEAGDMRWLTSATERMRLTAAGRLLVGTSTEGTNTVDIAGTLRSTQGANFATSSGNVGIGTETPDRAFHVDANNPTRGLMARIRNTASSSRTGTQILFTQSGIADYVIGSPAETDAFAFWVNRNPSADGTELMRLTGTGRLGIGTTSPSSLLHVSSDASNIRKSNAAGTAYTEHTNDGLIATGTSLTLFAPTSQSLILSSGNGEAARFNANKRLLVNTTTDAGYLVDVNGTLRTVNGANFATTSGSVGIGTTSPSEALDVNGRIRARTIDSTSSPINMLTSDVNGVIRKAAVPSGGGGTVTSVSAGTGMSFTTITTTGSVTVDTLSIATRARLYKTIDSMKAVGDVNVYNSNGTLTGNRVISKNGSNLTLSGDVGEFRVENAAGTSRVAVTNDGIYATGTSLTLFAPSAQSLILSSGNGEAGRFNADKEFLIGTSIDAGDYKLQVNGNGYVSGRMNIGSVDSFSTAQNMLFVDNDGRIKKAAVPAGGGGGVTSVATGFGIDGGTITSTGTLTADTVEMATRARVQKGIDSVAALARVTGSGTTNYVPLFTGSTALGNSSIYEASSEVLIGTTSDAGAFKLQVNGVAYASDGLRTTAPSGGTAHTWKLGSVVADSVALDPNNYLEVEVNGVFYRIALITLL